ncbi:MAG: HD domain-containing protein, partial [Elusimicrobia bacterium]|nr:HD domain-containing protein [Elusimicrobiota bacterium]
MNELFNKILKIAGKNEVYIVGGWLRDKILHKENRDLDIITLANPISIAKKIARGLNGRLVILDTENKIYRVVLKNDKRLDYIDISKMKGSNILADLKNRDFTINSFAVPLEKEIRISEIIDPFKGLSDLKGKKIRLTSAHALADDPLRMLRAYRMASELKFKIVPETIKQIKKYAPKIKQSAWERIREELFKILSSEDSLNKIEELEISGLLDRLFPEIDEMKRSGRKFYYHPKGLWQHSTETLRSLENIINNLDELFNKNGEKVRNHLNEPLSSGITRLNLLKIVSLFHDIAKPSTAKRVGDRMRFFGHESKGAQKVSEVLKRLRLGASDIKIAKTLVEHHMRPI